MSQPKTLTCHHPGELQSVASLILDAAGHRRKVILNGDLGAGKTALVAAMVLALGSPDEVSSPTFALAQDYLLPGQQPPVIHHLDAYRIKDQDEALEAGLLDYLEDEAWTFIEWPEVLYSWLPDERIEISITILPDTSREIVFLIL